MPQVDERTQQENTDLEALESSLGYSFQDRSHLVLALTHSSYAHETTKPELGLQEAMLSGPGACNERLEFLGDAVLGLVVTLHLYDIYPSLSEGKLSVMKSRLVSGSVLGKIAKALGLGKFLLLGRGEEKLGGRHRKSMLARTLEAVVGSIFLDGGLPAARQVILALLQQELQGIQRSIEQYDYKSQLQKITQNLYGVVPSYELVSQTGPDHGRVFRVRVKVKEQLFAIARGPSKKSAEQRAARLILRKVEKQLQGNGG